MVTKVKAVEPKVTRTVVKPALARTLERAAARVDLRALLTDREALKVMHRTLHESGWFKPWGEDMHARLCKAFDEFFGADNAHLKDR